MCYVNTQSIINNQYIYSEYIIDLQSVRNRYNQKIIDIYPLHNRYTKTFAFSHHTTN